MGAKAGQRDRSAGRQRLALVLFGALLLILFVGFAVGQGLGSPSVPSGDVAIVEEVPDEISQVSREDYDRAFVQQVAQAKLKKAPEPGSKKLEELQVATMNELLDRVWIQGEAEELGISITDKQVEDELATIKKQNFPTPDAYAKFLKESKWTQEDVNNRVRLQLLSSQIQETIRNGAPKPSQAEIESYYEAEKASQFTTKESRDARIVVNSDKGKVEAAKRLLEKDSTPAGWEKVAAKYSTDPTSKSKGGLQEGISEEGLTGPLKAAIFDGATGELVGPVEFQSNYILIEVTKLIPEKIQSLAEVKAQISSTLGQQKQQEYFSEFVNDYQTKWTLRTFCADEFVSLISRCANSQDDGRPANAPPACYEADPKIPATECPAPVTPISPALPGTITEEKPKGEPFPQRPLPESTPEQGNVVSEEPAAGAGAPPPSGAGAPPPSGE